MDQATVKDITVLKQIYHDSFKHAHTVGRIDWPDPTKTLFVEDIVNTGELYTFRLDRNIVGAARLSWQPDKRIWTDDAKNCLYLAKLATSEAVRGTNYLQQHMLPAIQEYAGTDTTLRLDCLSDNERLKSFYHTLGFVNMGDATFFSDRQGIEITVTRFEKLA